MHDYTFTKSDFSTIDNFKNIINQIPRESMFKEFNNRIDIDYLSNSDRIEGINTLENTEKLLTKKDLRVLRVYPSLIFSDKTKPTGLLDKIIGIKAFNIYGMAEHDKEKLLNQYLADIKLLIFNSKTNEEFIVQTTGHLLAITKALKEARHAGKSKKEGTELPLTHEFIVDELNKNILGLDIGRYRSAYYCPYANVAGATWSTANGSKVDAKMDELLDWYNNKSKDLHPIERAAILHTEFIKIHPFPDGNGRTARLLVNYELVKNGYPTITIKANNKSEYVKALDNAVVTHDVTSVVELFKKAMLSREKLYLLTFCEERKFDFEHNNPSITSDEETNIWTNPM